MTDIVERGGFDYWLRRASEAEIRAEITKEKNQDWWVTCWPRVIAMQFELADRDPAPPTQGKDERLEC